MLTDRYNETWFETSPGKYTYGVSFEEAQAHKDDGDVTSSRTRIEVAAEYGPVIERVNV